MHLVHPHPVKSLPAPAALVALLIYDLRGSGVCRNAIRLARSLRQQGSEVEILTVVPGGELARQAGDVVVRTLRDRPDRLGRLVGSVTAVGLLADYLRRHRPAVLLSMGNHVHPLAAAAHALADVSTQLVMRISNDLLHDRPSCWWSELWRLGARLIARPVLRTIFSAADYHIAVSNELKSAMVDHLGLSPETISVIANGVDIARVQALRTAPLQAPPSDMPVILGIGRLQRQKNFESLIEAIAIANRTRPMRLVLLGTGPRWRQQALLSLARRRGIADRVTLAGFVENPFAWLAAADQFVLSSSWEGASNALLEAMAAGCPVVATRCPTGTDEILAQGRVGPLVPVDDSPALAEAILGRLAQPRESDVLEAQARRYDGTIQMARYAALLSRIASQTPVMPASETRTGVRSVAA